ncbi:cytochrome-c oxidase subunit VIIa [Lyophyllum atratum]|nr:cytochrome-c oxidase subunit VIIa [Lyophyllum atratum]
MAIAPITGMLRKRFWLDLTCALGLGTAAGYGYWYGYHLKHLERQENFYIKLERERAAALS